MQAFHRAIEVITARKGSTMNQGQAISRPGLSRHGALKLGIRFAAVAVMWWASVPTARAQGTIPVPPAKPCPIGITIAVPLVLDEWMRLGGPNGPLGCPTKNFASDGPDGGGFYQFDNGQIAVSPDVWEKGVVAAYQDDGSTANCAGNCIFVDWTVSWTEPSHYNYDEFLVRWDFSQDGTNFSHDENANGCGDDFRGDGDQCEVMAEMGESQILVTNYWKDTHLKTKGSFVLSRDHGPGFYRIQVKGCDVHKVGGHTCRQDWMHPVIVQFKPGNDTMFIVNMSSVPSAHDVQSSRAFWNQRAAAITLYNACRVLPWTAFRYEEDYRTIILAKLAYLEYYQQDRCPGRTVNNRDEAFASLLQQHVDSKTGTSIDPKVPWWTWLIGLPGGWHLGYRTGEYDVALSGYIAAVYRYKSILPRNVYDHIVQNLLNKTGGLKASDLQVFLPVPETENHLNMIESARYLTNDLEYEQTKNSDYDNTKNGLREWWLKRLKLYLETDFIEYNARPYQGYTTAALQNLYSYARDRAVSTAAGMVLDYISVKLAISSSENRRAVPYRRKASYNNVNLLGWQADPQSARMLVLAGDLDILERGQGGSGRPVKLAPWYGMTDAQMAIVSNYRIPNAILDLILNPAHRLFYQGLHHYADELYASSPSFLISAGGHYASFAYAIPSGDDIGMALPTTVMPRGWCCSRDDFIAFYGGADDDNRSNMCVAPDFACGIYPIIPRQVLNRPYPNCVVKDGLWTFINMAEPCYDGRSQFYAAVYQKEESLFFGFVEVFDAAVNPNITFQMFVGGGNTFPFNRGVKDRNSSRTYGGLQPSNTYVTTTGQEVTFRFVALDSRILNIVNGPPVPSQSTLATGTIMNSEGQKGIIKIVNLYTGQSIELDDGKGLAPTEKFASVKAFDTDTCLQGFVWREADSIDHVCVTSTVREQTLTENSLAPSRHSPGSDLCLSGYVWREADPIDHVCVPALSRDQAAWDNLLAPSRRAIGVQPLITTLGGQIFSDFFSKESAKFLEPKQKQLLVSDDRFAEEAQTCSALVNAYKVTGDARFRDRAKTIADFLSANAYLAGDGTPGWGRKLTKGYGFFPDEDNFKGKDLWETTRALDCLIKYSGIDSANQTYLVLAQKVVDTWPSVEKPHPELHRPRLMRFYYKNANPHARRYVKNTNIAMGEALFRLGALTNNTRNLELAQQTLDAELWEILVRHNFGYHGAMIYVEPNDGNNAQILADEKQKVETDQQGNIVCHRQNPDPSCWDHIAFEAYELYQVQLLAGRDLSDPIGQIMRHFRSTPLGDTQRFDWNAHVTPTAITAYNCYIRDLSDPIYTQECLRALEHNHTGAWVFYSLVPDDRANPPH